MLHSATNEFGKKKFDACAEKFGLRKFLLIVRRHKEKRLKKFQSLDRVVRNFVDLENFRFVVEQ
jgi:hypothetical protein